MPTRKEESTLENTSLASKNDNDELEEDYFEFDDLDEEETNIIQIKNDFVKFDSFHIFRTASLCTLANQYLFLASLSA